MVPRDTIADIISGVLNNEPDWVALPAETQATIRTLLRRCLQKEANSRLHDIADARIEITEALMAPATTLPAVIPAIPPRAAWRRVMPWAAAVVLSVLVGVGVWQFRPETPVSRPISRFVMPLPPEDRIQVIFSPSVAISPTGSHVVYTGTGAGGQLYLRSLDSPEEKPIPGTQGGINPFFAPDGQWLGFFASGKLMKVALSGGPVMTLCDARAFAGATWGPDDTIVFSALGAEGSPSLFRVPAAGGMPSVLTKPDSAKGETAHIWPEFLPGVFRQPVFSPGRSMDRVPVGDEIELPLRQAPQAAQELQKDPGREPLPEDQEGQPSPVGDRRDPVAAEALSGSRHHRRLASSPPGPARRVVGTQPLSSNQ